MRIWRFQFGLRTLLLAVLILPPLIAFQYRRWYDDRIWMTLQDAKERRDSALIGWRDAYNACAVGQSVESQKAEADAQNRYYAARRDVETAVRALYARYGNSEQQLVRAMHARQRRN